MPAMKRRLAALLLACAATPVLAWNAAGHRLVAEIAWRSMGDAARQEAAALLARHPDHARWLKRAGDDSGHTAFVEASTWSDDIRRDARFHDDDEAPTPALPGLPDTARHRDWHYVDLAPDGSVRAGRADAQIVHFARLLADPASPVVKKTYALPWLIHLVADLHQPLHVGSRDDDGGNGVEIEDPFNPRRPFTNLHAWWDELPGPPWLRGRRLGEAADALLAAHPAPPAQGDPTRWREESRRLGLDDAYPQANGSLLPIVTPEFRARSLATAQRRLVEAGWRLGRLLDAAFTGVSRGTPARE